MYSWGVVAMSDVIKAVIVRFEFYTPIGRIGVSYDPYANRITYIYCDLMEGFHANSFVLDYKIWERELEHKLHGLSPEAVKGYISTCISWVEEFLKLHDVS